MLAKNPPVPVAADGVTTDAVPAGGAAPVDAVRVPAGGTRAGPDDVGAAEAGVSAGLLQGRHHPGGLRLPRRREHDPEPDQGAAGRPERDADHGIHENRWNSMYLKELYHLTQR